MPTAEAIAFPRGLWEQMLAQARTEAPYEACGVVAGDGTGRPHQYHPLRNAAGRLDWFEPDPLQLLRLTMDLDDRGETLWGIYHSHPRSPARPSDTDIEGANYPDAYYLIASLADADHPVLRCFQIREGAVREVALDIA